MCYRHTCRQLAYKMTDIHSEKERRTGRKAYKHTNGPKVYRMSEEKTDDGQK